MQQQTVIADFRTLAIDQLRESSTNPRRSFDETKLQELAQSIRTQGILVPLIVREREPQNFEVVAGARRFRAAQLAELFALPARVVELTDSEALTLQLVENAIREDVHPYEEAMAYKALLETSEPRYDVASISAKTGRSINHIYGRLRMAELIPEVAEVFQANQITAGHAALIARLPQEQQKQALNAAFREDWRSKEKHALPVRDLAQWIRDNLMLTLADAVFDRADAELLPEAGACITCPKRTGANAVLFDDFAHDDRCLNASCFQAKVNAHIAREKENTVGLVQITRAYYSNTKGEKVLTRSEYTVIEPKADQEGDAPEQQCSKATPAIVVEGPGQRGELVQVCTDPECEVHAKPNHRAEQEAATREREEQWKRQQQQRQKNQESNRSLLDAVLQHVPKTLTRADYEMLVLSAIDSFDYEHWDAIIERYNIDTEEQHEPDAAAFELRKKAQKATEPELIRMLVEFTLLPSGYSDEVLEPTDPLASAARRYNVSLTPKKTGKPKTAACTRSAPSKKPKGNLKKAPKSKATPSSDKIEKKAAVQRGTA